jgi:predicted O-methyltransferase YrrM
MIDLQHPDHAALLGKWQPIIDQTSHIFTWTSHLELAWLAEYATHCSHFLEIGSYNGRSAKVVLLANPKLMLTSIDTWDDGNLPTFQHNLGPEMAEGRVNFIQGLSQDLVRRDILNCPPEGFDGCFIDGGHLDDLVIADIKNVLPLMKPGSLMAGHDYRTENGQPNDVARGVHAALGTAFTNPLNSLWCHQT